MENFNPELKDNAPSFQIPAQWFDIIAKLIPMLPCEILINLIYLLIPVQMNISKAEQKHSYYSGFGMFFIRQPIG